MRKANADGRRRPAVASEMRSENAWIGGGIALALSVAAMALHQLSRNDEAPGIYGGSYLALFGRPALQARRAGEDRNDAQPGDTRRSPAVDYEATASIRKETPAAPGNSGVIGAPDLAYVDRGVGAFRTYDGLALRRIGESAPDGRTIAAFRRQDGGWVAVVAPQTSR